ncbi:hypothetical protein IGI39_001071 [Enterococcus sp. AZ135]
MSEPVLRPLTDSVEHFIEGISHPRKQKEAREMIALYSEVSGFTPVV